MMTRSRDLSLASKLIVAASTLITALMFTSCTYDEPHDEPAQINTPNASASEIVADDDYTPSVSYDGAIAQFESALNETSKTPPTDETLDAWETLLNSPDYEARRDAALALGLPTYADAKASVADWDDASAWNERYLKFIRGETDLTFAEIVAGRRGWRITLGAHDIDEYGEWTRYGWELKEREKHTAWREARERIVAAPPNASHKIVGVWEFDEMRPPENATQAKQMTASYAQNAMAGYKLRFDADGTVHCQTPALLANGVEWSEYAMWSTFDDGIVEMVSKDAGNWVKALFIAEDTLEEHEADEDSALAGMITVWRRAS